MELDWLKKWNLYSPHSVALKEATSGHEITYREFFYLSQSLAAFLRREFNIQRGDRVAVLSKNNWQYVPLFFALQRLGAILVPINFRLTPAEVNHILQDSEPQVFFVQEEFRVNHSQALAYESLCEQMNPFLEAEPTEIFFEGEADDPCMILYTSGTTGAPKGALITNKMIFWNSINTSLRLNLTQSDVQLSFLPFFHTGGWNVLLTPFIHRGAKTLILEKFDPEQILDLAEKERATILFGVPTMMDMMAKSKNFESCDLSSVRYAIVGGEPMPTRLIQIWQEKNIPVRQGYGLTEFGPNVFSLNEEDSLRKIGSIGFPNFYIEAKINEPDETGTGELALKGPTCTPGYWRNEQATKQAIQDGWFCTGDLVRRDEDGYFYVVGRKKDMFISGGENVYPPEVEAALLKHPAIKEVAVVGVPDSTWGEVGKAFVVVGENLSVEQLQAFAKDHLAKYKVPKFYEFVDELPKGDSGKVLKRVLRDGMF